MFTWTTFIAPFHGEIWLCLFSISLDTSIILWILLSYTTKISSKEIVYEKITENVENVENCDRLKCQSLKEGFCI